MIWIVCSPIRLGRAEQDGASNHGLPWKSSSTMASWWYARMYGSFRRAIPLPEGANTDQAKANFQNGVLEVSIPVPQGALKGRQIPIEGGTSDKKGLETAQTREPKTH